VFRQLCYATNQPNWTSQVTPTQALEILDTENETVPEKKDRRVM